MKREYAIDVDVTMSRRYYVEANNDEEAREKVEELLKNNPYDYDQMDTYVGHEIIEVNVV